MRIAINGFGRIGRVVLRQWIEQKEKYGDLEIVAINDLSSIEATAFLLRYDSTFGPFKANVQSQGPDRLIVNDHEIKVTGSRDPKELPWKSLDVDLVFECTGAFRSQATAGGHISSGAKRVMISAPGKDVGTFVMGVNHTDFDLKKDIVFSNASCTTNCLAPMAKVIHDTFGIKHGFVTTIHSYTNDQNVLDGHHEDWRRARSAAQNIIPTTTGAAKAVGKVIPSLAGKLDGLAVRVPTPNVSLTDLVAELKKSASANDVNAALKEASETTLKNYLAYSDEPLVSSDFNGSYFSSIVDGLSTAVIGESGSMVKALSWYDNETGFSCRMLDLAQYIGRMG